MVCAPVRRNNPRAFSPGIIDRTGAQTMLYLTCTTITSVDLAHYGAKDWVSVGCSTMTYILPIMLIKFRLSVISFY